MSTITPTPTESPSPGTGLRPTLEELRENTRLLITLRWVAGLSILLGTLAARLFLDIGLQTLPLLIIGLSVLGYNTLLWSFIRAGETSHLQRVQQIAWGQIILDWLAMIVLVHFTGGITSPALIYFVIHAALSGTILLPWQTRSLVGLAVVIVGGLAWFERNGGLPHVRIAELGLDNDLYQNTTYIAAIVFFFGTTILTLSDLVTRNAQRLRQREKHIRELYDARATFVRVATHELRAPLGASLSLMRNIEQGYAGELSPQQRTILTRVTSRLEGLRTLIDDLLTLATSREASTAHAPLEPDSVRAVLERIIEREKPHADHKAIRLDCDLSREPGIVMAGDVGLGIIFGNLLNNAIKYTPEGGHVAVQYRIAPAAHAAEITVQDSGMGIPADDLPHIFNEFFRAKNAKNSQVMGTGIGLSTVRTLVERYQGQITLESDEGQGTTVRVSLPLAPDQTPPKDRDGDI
ncbi:MAG: sensor histidine kinase [Chloroflexi bacterium]|nr:MAG: sensor histidine kinase [Chloroflexota bacterium]